MCPHLLRSLKAVLLIFVFTATFFHARAEVSVPDTPAGRVLHAFLDAFDSADRTRIEAYLKEYDPSRM